VDGCLDLGALGVLVVWSLVIARVRGGPWRWLLALPGAVGVAIAAGIASAVVASVAGSTEAAVFAATVSTTTFRALLLVGLVACAIGSIPGR
jgi:hypothetical protein